MSSLSQHTVIKCEDLSIGYQNKKKTSVIASAINFSITQGTLVALVGSNGIGKSTLLKSLTAIHEDAICRPLQMTLKYHLRFRLEVQK